MPRMTQIDRALAGGGAGNLPKLMQRLQNRVREHQQLRQDFMRAQRDWRDLAQMMRSGTMRVGHPRFRMNLQQFRMRKMGLKRADQVVKQFARHLQTLGRIVERLAPAVRNAQQSMNQRPARSGLTISFSFNDGRMAMDKSAGRMRPMQGSMSRLADEAWRVEQEISALATHIEFVIPPNTGCWGQEHGNYPDHSLDCQRCCNRKFPVKGPQSDLASNGYKNIRCKAACITTAYAKMEEEAIKHWNRALNLLDRID